MAVEVLPTIHGMEGRVEFGGDLVASSQDNAGDRRTLRIPTPSSPPQ